MPRAHAVDGTANGGLRRDATARHFPGASQRRGTER